MGSAFVKVLENLDKMKKGNFNANVLIIISNNIIQCIVVYMLAILHAYRAKEKKIQIVFLVQKLDFLIRTVVCAYVNKGISNIVL